MESTISMDTCFCNSVKSCIERRVKGSVSVTLSDCYTWMHPNELVVEIITNGFHARMVIPEYSYYLLYGYRNKVVQIALSQYRDIINQTFFNTK